MKNNDNNYIKELYENGTELKITGIAKVKDKNISSWYLGYTEELTKYINDTKDYIIKSETKYKSSMEQEPKIGLTVPVQCPKSNLKANVKMGLNNFAPIKVSDENESNAV